MKKLLILSCCLLAILAGCSQSFLLDDAPSEGGTLTVNLYVNGRQVGSSAEKSITTTTNAELKSFSVTLDGDQVQYVSASQGTVTFSGVSIGDHNIVVLGYTDEAHSADCVAQSYSQSVTITTDATSPTITANLAQIWEGDYYGDLALSLQWPTEKGVKTVKLIDDATGATLATLEVTAENTTIVESTSTATMTGKVPVGKSRFVTIHFYDADGDQIASCPEIMNVCAAETSTFLQTTQSGETTETKTTLVVSNDDFSSSKPISVAALALSDAADSLKLSWKMPNTSDYTSVTVALFKASDNSQVSKKTIAKADLVSDSEEGYYKTTFSTLASGTDYYAKLVVNYTKDGETVCSDVFTTATLTSMIQATGVDIASTLSDKAMSQLVVGNTVKFTATPTPADAYDLGVTWSSSDASILKLTDADTGTFTVMGYGNATVTATLGNCGVSNTYGVTISSLSFGSVNVTVESSYINVVWGRSEKSSIYQVLRKSEDGEYSTLTTITATSDTDCAYKDTAIAAGTTYTYRIDMLSEDGSSILSSSVSDSVYVESFTPSIVINPADKVPTSIQVIFNTATGFKLNLGETKEVSLLVIPDGVTCKWYLNKTHLAEYDDQATITLSDSTPGLNTMMIAGSQYLMAVFTTEDGISYSGTLTFNYIDTIDVAVTLSSSNPTTIKTSDGAVQFNATVMTSDGTTHSSVEWSSSDNTVATVNNTGNVTALKDGQATITATSTTNSALTASTTITCIKPVTGIQWTSTGKNVVFVGGQNGYGESSVKAAVLPSGATNQNVTYSSSNTAAVTVDSTGAITSVGGGSATITASSVDGNFATTFEVTSYQGDIYYVEDKDGKTQNKLVTDTNFTCTGAAGSGNSYKFEARYTGATVVDTATTFSGYSIVWSFDNAKGSKTSYGLLGSYLRLQNTSSYTVTLNREASLKDPDVYATLLDGDGNIIKAMKFTTKP